MEDLMIKRKKAKKIIKKRTVRRTRRKSKKALSPSASAYWASFRELQERANQAVARLQASIKRNAAPEILMQEQKNLMLILGECEYMTRECKKMASWNKNR